jgi:hypothetical protein
LKMSWLFTPRMAGTTHKRERSTMRPQVTHGVPGGRTSRFKGKTNISTSQERVLDKDRGQVYRVTRVSALRLSLYAGAVENGATLQPPRITTGTLTYPYKYLNASLDVRPAGPYKVRIHSRTKHKRMSV